MLGSKDMPGPKKGAPQRRGPLGTCSIEGCHFNVLALGLCQTHYTISQKAEREAAEQRITKGELRVGKNGRTNGGPGGGTNGAGRPPAIPYDESTIKRLRELGGLQCTLKEAA